MADRITEFSRIRNGYDPQEVNAVIIELQRQISDVKQQNTSLAASVTQYDGKIRQLADNTRRLQEERAQESLRVTGMMNAAMKMAEQTKQDALIGAKTITENAQREVDGLIESTRQDAVRITDDARLEAGRLMEKAKLDADVLRRQAQADFMAARTALNILNESAQAIRRHNEQYITGANVQLSEIDTLVNNALTGIPAVPAQAPAQAPYIPPAPVTPQAPQEPFYTPPPVPGTAADPYEDFVKSMKDAGQQPKYP